MTGRSTVFANTMIGLVSRLLDVDDRLPNPLAGHDMADLLVRQYWMGSYFRDSLCRNPPSGDANLRPFFFEVVTDTEMQRRAFATLEGRGFTQPVPLRYFDKRLPEAELPVPKAFPRTIRGSELDAARTGLSPSSEGHRSPPDGGSPHQAGRAHRPGPELS
jgi:hypothetical protein